jgi:hypothetical protein
MKYSRAEILHKRGYAPFLELQDLCNVKRVMSWGENRYVFGWARGDCVGGLERWLDLGESEGPPLRCRNDDWAV